MPISYLSHDEVNAALARRLAGRHGLRLDVLAIKEVVAAAAADHLILDLDHLPREVKAALLARARTGTLRPRVSAHSYNLTRGEARALTSAGVRVGRRLTARLLTRKVSVRR